MPRLTMFSASVCSHYLRCLEHFLCANYEEWDDPGGELESCDSGRELLTRTGLGLSSAA